MDEQEPNPYESPRASVPPIYRLGLIGRCVVGVVAAVVAVVSTRICFNTICYGGLYLGFYGPGTNRRLTNTGLWLMVGFSVLVGILVAVLVARVLYRAWVNWSRD